MCWLQTMKQSFSKPSLWKCFLFILFCFELSHQGRIFRGKPPKRFFFLFLLSSELVKDRSAPTRKKHRCRITVSPVLGGLKAFHFHFYSSCVAIQARLQDNRCRFMTPSLSSRSRTWLQLARWAECVFERPLHEYVRGVEPPDYTTCCRPSPAAECVQNIVFMWRVEFRLSVCNWQKILSRAFEGWPFENLQPSWTPADTSQLRKRWWSYKICND